MNERDLLAERFEDNRTRLPRRRLPHVTTVIARVALNMLRSRRARREEPIGAELPEPILDRPDGMSPEHEALPADSVGLALLVDRSPEAARQLASRARRRVQGEGKAPDADLETQRRVVDAFLAASREGDFERLVEVLDPAVVLRADLGTAGRSRVIRGARAIADQALFYSQLGLDMRPVPVNGAVGVVTFRDGEPFSVGALTGRGGKIVELDFLADPERLRELDLAILD